MPELPQWARALASGLLTSVQNERLPDLDTPRRASEQLGHWAAHLSRSVIHTWGPYLLTGQPCSFECYDDALGDCIVCSDPVCLAHAHVSHRGELLCDECVDKSIGKSKKQTKEQRAFEYFNLTSVATFEEVNAVYRVRSKHAHPDQGGQSMTELNVHYDVLKDYFRRRAA